MSVNPAPQPSMAEPSQGWTDRYWTSRDGLKLHFRDYAGPAGKPPLLCMPGLTRNARDFAALAERLAGTWRVICPDLRGRGDSDYAKDPASYNPLQYAEDIELLLEQEQIARFVPFGTSLGGLITMLLAGAKPERIAGVLLNDVGPELDPAGLARIREYVGQGRSFPTWMHAARGIEESQAKAYPRYTVADWLAMAKRVMVLGAGGRIVFDYDMKIAEALVSAEQPAAEFDMWPLFTMLEGRPAALLRGELSDVLSAAAHQRMAERLTGAEAVTVPAVGHAPMLDEPEAAAAIDRLLARIA
ncbi:MAG: alpha/beta fold hydrolase [Novosphingobium sp.]